jgi:leucyl aminopeptidase
MNFEITIAKTKDIKADVEVIFVQSENLEHRFIQDKKLLKKAGFKASQDEVCYLLERDRVYVGIQELEGKYIRRAAAKAIRAIKTKKYKSLKVASYTNKGCTYGIRAMVEGFVLGVYEFDKYKSTKNKNSIKKIIISTDEYSEYELDIQKASIQMHKGELIAQATNLTRDIVNTPPDDCYPQVMAKIAKKVAKECALECDVLKVSDLQKEKMNALLAVARASRHKPKVIHLAHKPKDAKIKISIIGKGLTYDSGGLSLKPSDFMVTMKSDKSGASAVIGILQAVAKLKLPIEVHGFIGAVENMIGGDAYKPDDVLVAKNGKTIEVRNTDAEGRLVLADVLCYAQEQVKADYIFDLATLTGACVVGVGEYTSGVMGHNQNLKEMVVREAHYCGELATALDFNDYLKDTLKSKIADISNISNTRYGGAITAGLFLSEFIDEHHKNKWSHIDIAGPAYVEHEWGENPAGASGAGVRMMVKLIEKLTMKSKHN